MFTHSQEGETSALWLQVLLNLSSITIDERVEVRNSAIQTIQRIFENCSDQLSSNVWLLCLRTILFGMMEANLNVQRDIRGQQLPRKGLLKDWGETTKVVLQTVGVLNTTYMEKLDASQLGGAWSELLDLLQRYFIYRSHTLGASVFNTITGVLSHTDNSHVWSTEPLLKTVIVWKSYFTSPDAWKDADKEDNQEAFVAYAEAFKAIYRLADRPLAQDLPSMLANLEACIVNSDEVAYSSDVDSMTTLQNRVMECLSMVKTEDTEIPSYLIRLLGRFITLPYTSVDNSPDKRGPTFVALSKASMTLLQEITVKHVDHEDIYTSNAMTFALMSLARPVQEKYSWQREGRAPTLWQKATRTAIAILTPTLPHIGSNKETWTTIVEIAQYMTRAHLSRELQASLEKDEQFDVDSFMELRNLVTLPLGSASLPDSVRRTYTHNLFSTSLAHSPLPDELPDVSSSPLNGLYKIRLGQTAELECTLRPAMGFACLSELFHLVAVQDSSAERVKLAQAAAPYLILRCALPLKTYIADHPLRGRMPAPESQRRELLFVLSELEKLESEPQAIPDAPGVRSKYRRHLHRLYPLIVKATKVARRDAEVLEQLAKLTDLVGDEFGLDDD